MEVNADTRLIDVLQQYPWLSEELPKLDSRFSVMNSAAGKLLMRKNTVRDASRLSGHPVEELLAELQKLIARHEG